MKRIYLILTFEVYHDRFLTNFLSVSSIVTATFEMLKETVLFFAVMRDINLLLGLKKSYCVTM